MEKKTPKIFISYSWFVQDWVEALANRLMNDGVETIIDIWDLKEGQDKYVFMESMVNDKTIDFVLIVCDRSYTKKANDRKGGVGDETVIISSELYGKSEQTKFIPIILEKDDNGEAICPTYIKSRIHFDFSDANKYEDNYEKLLRCIHKEPLKQKPKLGKKPEWLNNAVSTSSLDNMVSILNRANNETRKDAAILSFCHEFVKKAKEYTFDDSNRSVEILGKNMESLIDSMKPLRDAYLDFLDELVLSEKDIVGFVHRFFECVYNELTRPPEGKSFYRSYFEPYQFLIWEMFVCTIANLRYHEKYKEIHDILTQSFFLRDELSPSENEEPKTFLEFRSYLQFFDGEYGKRLKLYSLSADKAVKRLKEPFISKTSFAETDVFLTQMSFALDIARKGHYWFAQSYIYLENSVKMWNRLQSRSFCEKILPLFGAKTIQEMKTILLNRPVTSEYKYNEDWYCVPSILSNEMTEKIAQLP